MQDARPPIIRLAIHILMLVGLILILPEERVASEKTTMIEYPEPENVSQVVIPPHAKHTAAIRQLKSQSENATAMQL